MNVHATSRPRPADRAVAEGGPVDLAGKQGRENPLAGVEGHAKLLENKFRTLGRRQHADSLDLVAGRGNVAAEVGRGRAGGRACTHDDRMGCERAVLCVVSA